VVKYVCEEHEVSVNRACKLIGIHKSANYYKGVKDDTELIVKLQELAHTMPSRGLDEFVGRLRSMGYRWNRKRIYRVYKELKLNKRKKIRRRLPKVEARPLKTPESSNQCWSMDFMSDSLRNGRKIRILNIIDDFNREALWNDAQYGYPSEFVVRALENIKLIKGLPKFIRVDNGPEFRSNVFKEYCEDNGIRINYIEPGKPMQNAYIERFNRHFREDILDAYLFESKHEVNKIIAQWQSDYNYNHPHKSLSGLSPVAFAKLSSKGKIHSNSVKAEMNASLQEAALTEFP
jgi:putative transposase